MDFIETLTQRHSIRSFSERPVPQEVLNALLNQALKSPSWSNTQPYCVAIAQGELRNQLAQELTEKFNRVSKWQAANPLKKLWSLLTNNPLPDGDFKPIIHYPKDLQPRRQATGVGLYQPLGIARDDHQARQEQMAKNFCFFDAPVVLFIFMHKGLGVYSALDSGIFLQSLMLAATNAGLGTCAQGALAAWRSPIEKYFSIPSQYQLLTGLSLGYPSQDPVNQFQPERRQVAEISLPATQQLSADE